MNYWNRFYVRSEAEIIYIIIQIVCRSRSGKKLYTLQAAEKRLQYQEQDSSQALAPEVTALLIQRNVVSQDPSQVLEFEVTGQLITGTSEDIKQYWNFPILSCLFVKSLNF
ncbi:unnamed protein product [Allacma fusca]|uniref:Uncharacterized protein n=1 Tax=Allacma fusca TaxID=39272 RepID=A0A8J2NQG3_9HEXA|nr:unnamed protein product [Allacma fusca]